VGSTPKNWTPWIYFNGQLMDASSVANLNWGYVGTNMGYGGLLLDNPLTNHGEGDTDAFFIHMGIDWANGRR
jgi:hypothetical protein